MESLDASVGAAGASEANPATSPDESRNSSGLSGAASEFSPAGVARTAVCSVESSVYSSSRRGWVLVLFCDMVGLTFVGRDGVTGIGSGAAAPRDETERFGDVFSKLRAGCVALGGGADGAPV